MKHLWVFKKRPQELMKELKKYLCKKGYKTQNGREFTYAPGQIPIMLVAHIDTVHHSPPETIYVDKKKGTIWSKQGIGADDRAGVTAILNIIDRGYKPHILFTDGEESGGTGAREALRKIDIPEVKYIIELDRKGSNDAVYYNCNNKEFMKYITDFGFQTAEGVFSDISILCPEWEISGVNLSIGYYNAHNKNEYLFLKEWKNTIEKLIKMLNQVPEEKYLYVPGENLGYGFYYDDFYDMYDPDQIIIEVPISVIELMELYGGDTLTWYDILEENQVSIVEKAKRAIYEKIDKVMQIKYF